MDGPPKVFVSHTTQDHRDLALARALAEGLALQGVDVWIAPENIPSGARWADEIAQNLSQATHFIVILSAASVFSDWVQKEIELARLQYDKGQLQILPLIVGRVGSFPNEHFLSQFQQLNYSADIHSQVEQVVAALGLPSTKWTEYLRQILTEFDTGSLLSHRMNVALSDLSPVRLSRLRDQQEAENLIESVSLDSLMKENSSVLLVGPGGSGKTTALQWLTYRAAKEAIQAENPAEIRRVPVFIDLSQYKEDLLKLIRRTLISRGVDLDESNLRSELKQGTIQLLLDGFDEIGNRRQLLTDVAELLTNCHNSGIVLTSRPVSALNAIAFARFKRFDIEPLNNLQIKEILTLRLGQTKAGALFQLMEQGKVLEAFRQPLIVLFVSIAYQESELPPAAISKGTLYDKVTNYFLEQWEAKHYEALISDDTLIKVSVLNRLGYEMVCQRVAYLPEERVRAICTEETKHYNLSNSDQVHLLENLFSTGLLKRSSEGATFSHLTLRDFFAAKWLRDRFNLGQILTLSWKGEWHEPLVYLTGLLPNAQARKWLMWTIRFSKLTTSFAQHFSHTWTANQILLTLNCLGNTSESHDDLKDRFLEQLRGRQTYLANTSISADLTFPFGVDTVYASFCALVGRLNRPLSLEILNEVKSRQTRICGLAQLRDIDLLLREFESPDQKDGIADLLAAYFIFGFPVATVVPTIEKFLDSHDAAQKTRLLESINSCFHSGSEGLNERYSPFGQEDSGWLQLLARVALHEEDKTVQDSALSIIRSFGRYKGWLPGLAENIIMEVAKSNADETIRVRGIWYLAYGETPASLELLQELINEGSPWLALTAADALRHRDRKNFPTYMSRILMRFFSAHPPSVDVLGELIAAVKNMGMDVDDAANAESNAFFLVAGAILPESHLYRDFSVEALFLTKLRVFAPLLERIMIADENERVRTTAMRGLSSLLGADAEPSILKALDDPAPAVRGGAVETLHYFLPPEARVKATPKLEELERGDPDAGVRKKARWALETIRGESYW